MIIDFNEKNVIIEDATDGVAFLYEEVIALDDGNYEFKDHILFVQLDGDGFYINYDDKKYRAEKGTIAEIEE